jgi:catechol 2,3-dioxygenase-like lactoylglutathione lyase family enzyme
MKPPASGGVRGLGELALRVRDLEATTAFYRDVVGLDVLREFDHATFFDLGEGHGGHTTIVALFDRADEPSALEDGDYVPPDPAATSVDHFAFTVDLEDFDAERERLASLGVDLDSATHEWVSWRSLYFADPEGNRVEFVCYDPAVADDAATN